MKMMTLPFSCLIFKEMCSEGTQGNLLCFNVCKNLKKLFFRNHVRR